MQHPVKPYPPRGPSSWRQSRRVRVIAAALLASVGILLSIISNEPSASAAPNISGMAVFLDPGHNGGYDSSMTRQVPNGRGGTKECNTTGAATSDGYPEHAFTWDVVARIQGELNQLGVRTQLSRGDDSSAGPCVDERAARANA